MSEGKGGSGGGDSVSVGGHGDEARAVGLGRNGVGGPFDVRQHKNMGEANE